MVIWSARNRLGTRDWRRLRRTWAYSYGRWWCYRWSKRRQGRWWNRSWSWWEQRCRFRCWWLTRACPCITFANRAEGSPWCKPSINTHSMEFMAARENPYFFSKIVVFETYSTCSRSAIILLKNRCKYQARHSFHQTAAHTMELPNTRSSGPFSSDSVSSHKKTRCQHCRHGKQWDERNSHDWPCWVLDICKDPNLNIATTSIFCKSSTSCSRDKDSRYFNSSRVSWHCN